MYSLETKVEDLKPCPDHNKVAHGNRQSIHHPRSVRDRRLSQTVTLPDAVEMYVQGELPSVNQTGRGGGFCLITVSGCCFILEVTSKMESMIYGIDITVAILVTVVGLRNSLVHMPF